MKLLIDVPEELYNNFQSRSKEDIDTNGTETDRAIYYGIPFGTCETCEYYQDIGYGKAGLYFCIKQKRFENPEYYCPVHKKRVGKIIVNKDFNIPHFEI